MNRDGLVSVAATSRGNPQADPLTETLQCVRQSAQGETEFDVRSRS